MPRFEVVEFDANTKKVHLSQIGVRECRWVPIENLGLTDRALGAAIGTVYEQIGRMYRLVELANAPPGQNSPRPDISRNPYSQVPLAGKEPWTTKKAERGSHFEQAQENYTGWLEYDIELKTPLFVPESIPVRPQENADPADPLHNTPRHFCRMQDDQGRARYAIPGQSLKGAIGSKIEQITNNALRVFDKDAHGRRHLYRRRAVRQAGKIVAENDKTLTVSEGRVVYFERHDWETQDPHTQPWIVVAEVSRPNPPFAHGNVEPKGKLVARPVSWLNGKQADATGVFHVRPPHGREKWYSLFGNDSNPRLIDITPHAGGLLVQPTRAYKYFCLLDVGRQWTLPQTVVSIYRDSVISHGHFEGHYTSRYNENVGFYDGCNKTFDAIKARDLDLTIEPGSLVFFTAPENAHITTIGKNVNYLWPAQQSVKDLVSNFAPREEMSLEDERLGMADLLLGFAGKHRRAREQDGEQRMASHPFRGLLSFETAWGPVAEDRSAEEQWPELTRDQALPQIDLRGFKVRLAPLTSPKTQGKCRPLMLEPSGDGRSASYDDPGARLRGRKEYWHQVTTAPERPIWDGHLYDERFHDAVQCPPPLLVLNPNEQNVFSGTIRFKNLRLEQLGAVVAALQGQDDPNYCLKLGKAKPRGLGSVQFRIKTAHVIDFDTRFSCLADGAGLKQDANLPKMASDCFLKWQGSQPEFAKVAKATKALGAFPPAGHGSVRYYPPRFSDYSWLPDDKAGNTLGEPRHKSRPPAPPPA